MSGAQRELTFRFLAEPTDVNYGGKVHGGVVMKWIDQVGYAAAVGWSGRYSVTVAVGGIRFVAPIRTSDLVTVTAKLVYTGTSSMHFAIDVRARDPMQDGGDRFERIARNGQALAVLFSLDGRQLWFATYDTKPHLLRMDLGKRTSTEISLPPLASDAVSYIAQDPVAPSSYAIATFERDLYVTANAGAQWRQIAQRGRTKR